MSACLPIRHEIHIQACSPILCSEAHNVEGVCSDSSSFDITAKSITESMAEAKKWVQAVRAVGRLGSWAVGIGQSSSWVVGEVGQQSANLTLSQIFACNAGIECYTVYCWD